MVIQEDVSISFIGGFVTHSDVRHDVLHLDVIVTLGDFTSLGRPCVDQDSDELAIGTEELPLVGHFAESNHQRFAPWKFVGVFPS